MLITSRSKRVSDNYQLLNRKPGNALNFRDWRILWPLHRILQFYLGGLSYILLRHGEKLYTFLLLVLHSHKKTLQIFLPFTERTNIQGQELT